MGKEDKASLCRRGTSLRAKGMTGLGGATWADKELGGKAGKGGRTKRIIKN